MEKAAEFVLMLLHAVTNTHILHLRSRSFSEHMALGAFYDGLSDLVDGLAESIQGKYGLLMEFPTDYVAPMDNALDELQSLSDYVQDERMEMPQDSEVQNQIDEIQSLINSTLYKLRFLK